MPNIMFDQEKAYFSLDVTEDDIQRESVSVQSDVQKFNQILKNEADVDVREVARRRLNMHQERLRQLNVKKDNLARGGA